MYTMNDDGTDMLPVAGYPADYPALTPSRERHADKRWFPDLVETPGDEYYPDGASRWMFILLSDADDFVPVEVAADLQMFDLQWTVGDHLSWVGRRWDINPESPGYGTVLEGGIYVTPLVFDDDGGVTAGASFLLVPFTPLIVLELPWHPGEPALGPDIQPGSYDWAPDGIHFVFETASTGQLRIGQINGDSELLYADQARWPKWSPAGDKIAFQRGAIKVINTDGSGLKTLVRSNPNYSVVGCVWSPTGSHLLYHHSDHFFQDSYIVRMTSTGRDKTRLTDESMGWGGPGTPPWALAWRE
jgi:hypothetical protein